MEQSMTALLAVGAILCIIGLVIVNEIEDNND